MSSTPMVAQIPILKKRMMPAMKTEFS